MGWPQFVPTAEKDLFTRKIIETKVTMMSRMLKRDEVRLRDGVASVIQDAQDSGACVALIAGTQCDAPDEVAASVLRQLGEPAAEGIAVFNCPGAQGAASPVCMLTRVSLAHHCVAATHSHALRFAPALGLVLAEGAPSCDDIAHERLETAARCCVGARASREHRPVDKSLKEGCRRSVSE